MDGRVALKLGVCLLIASAGCQHQAWTVPSPGPNSQGNNLPAVPAPDPSQVKKESGKPKDIPPMVLVVAGDWRTAEAFSPGVTSEVQQYNCEVARTSYENALKTDPKCVPAYQGLARLYTKMHDFGLAIENYQKALKYAPNNASLWYEMGVCHNHQKDWNPALECLNRAAQLDPSNRSYVNTQAVVLAAAGHYEESLNCFVRTNGEAMGYYRLAQTLQHLQQPELSRRYLEVAMQKNPSLAPAPAMAMRNGGEEVVSETPPAVQQTAYQAPPAAQQGAYQAPSIPPQETPPATEPQIISMAGPAPVPQPPQPRLILPSPPAIELDYEQANP